MFGGWISAPYTRVFISFYMLFCKVSLSFMPIVTLDGCYSIIVSIETNQLNFLEVMR